MKKNNIKGFFNSRGFTLLEVMIATVILFSVIASVSLIYRGAFISSEKANKNIEIATVIPAIISQIQSDIRSQSNQEVSKLKGNGKIWNIQYTWQASLLEYKSAPEKFDVDLGKFITPPLKYKLWSVQLELSHNGVNKYFQFKEMSWSNV
jgi:prepilin-type N-terminal cleavage/methylation domain-containing protein